MNYWKIEIHIKDATESCFFYKKIAPTVKNEDANTFEKGKHENASLLDEAEDMTMEEVLRNFYSKITSLETLKQIIDTVFDVSIKNTEKQSDALINSFVKHAVYERIWNMYKQTEKELKEKEAFETEGNHVRHVVQPLAKRVKNMEIEQRQMKADLKANQERMQANLEAKLERMEKLLLKLAEK
eukprot:g4446.t1